MTKLETVRIVDESKPAGYRIVNRTEYDRNRKKWKLWKPPEPEPEPPKPAPPPPSPSISTSTADKEAGGGSNSKRGGSKGPDRK